MTILGGRLLNITNAVSSKYIHEKTLWLVSLYCSFLGLNVTPTESAPPWLHIPSIRIRVDPAHYNSDAAQIQSQCL